MVAMIAAVLAAVGGCYRLPSRRNFAVLKSSESERIFVILSSALLQTRVLGENSGFRTLVALHANKKVSYPEFLFGTAPGGP